MGAGLGGAGGSRARLADHCFTAKGTDARAPAPDIAAETRARRTNSHLATAGEASGQPTCRASRPTVKKRGRSGSARNDTGDFASVVIGMVVAVETDMRAPTTARSFTQSD